MSPNGWRRRFMKARGAGRSAMPCLSGWSVLDIARNRAFTRVGAAARSTASSHHGSARPSAARPAGDLQTIRLTFGGAFIFLSRLPSEGIPPRSYVAAAFQVVTVFFFGVSFFFGVQ